MHMTTGQTPAPNYNYIHDYDPAIGRYVESDPIGLAGGITLPRAGAWNSRPKASRVRDCDYRSARNSV
jgi:hypothetical protein